MNVEEQFNIAKGIIALYARRFSKATNVPIEEYESAMCAEFADKAPKYNGKISFKAYIKPILNQCALRVADVKRKERRFYDRVVHVDGLLDENGSPEFEFADSTKVDVQALEQIEKTPDKRELIEALVVNADEVTVAAVGLMLRNPNASLNSIATEVGIHHEILKRRLRRLAKNYDQTVFGDLSQYLAV